MRTPHVIGRVSLAALVLLGPPWGIASANDPAPRFSAKCHVDGNDFEIAFASKSGDPLNDDMTVTYRGIGGEKALAVKPGLYYPARVTTETGAPKSICDTIPGFEIEGHRPLLFLTRDQRPGYSVLSLALLDASKGVLQSAHESVALFKQSETNTPYVVRKGKTGFHTRLVREVLKSSSDGAENYIEDWNVIEVHGKHITVGWRDPLKKCD